MQPYRRGQPMRLVCYYDYSFILPLDNIIRAISTSSSCNRTTNKLTKQLPYDKSLNDYDLYRCNRVCYGEEAARSNTFVLASEKLSNITLDLSDCPCQAINNEPFSNFLSTLTSQCQLSSSCLRSRLVRIKLSCIDGMCYQVVNV